MKLEDRRASELEKYEAIYGAGIRYTMNQRRKDQSIAAMREFLSRNPGCTNLLDVGCGDGQWMEVAAKEFGLACVGVDPVSHLAGKNVLTAPATDLPFDDDSFDVVTCLDVMEHLVPEDTMPALKEIARVARYGAIITVNNNPSAYRGIHNTELHVNIRPYEEWAALMVEVFGAAEMLNDEGKNRVFLV